MTLRIPREQVRNVVLAALARCIQAPAVEEVVGVDAARMPEARSHAACVEVQRGRHVGYAVLVRTIAINCTSV